MSNLAILESTSKKDVLKSLFRNKVVAVIRIDQPGDLVNVSEALLEGGH